MIFKVIAPYIKVFAFIHNLFVLIFAFLFPEEIPKYLLVVTIITHVYTLIILHRAKAAFILFFFMLTYILFLVPYFFNDVNMGLHIKYQESIFYEKLVRIWLIFLLTFLLVIKKNINVEKYSIIEFIRKDYNSIRFYSLCIISLIFVAFLFTKGENLLFANGNKYEIYLNNLEEVGGLSVLFFIVYILNSIYSKNTKFQKKILMLIAFLYLVFAISRGTRMLVASMGFVLYILFFENYLKTSKLIGLLFISFILLIGLNSIKNNVLLKDFKLTIPNKFGHESILMNQTEVLYGSAAVFGLIDEKLLENDDRSKLSLGLLATSFVPPRFLPRTHKYPSLIYRKTHIGGGGLAITVIYLGYGYVGVILFAIYIALVINFAYSKYIISKLIRIFALAVLCLGSRWFSYDLNVAYRLPIYTVILFFGFNSIFFTLKKYENRS